MPSLVVNLGRRDLLKLGTALLLTTSAPVVVAAQPAGDKLKIGVIGAGHIGGLIGGLWVKAGHPVLFSSRHPEELKSLVESMGPLAKAGSVGDALDFADVIFIAVPYKAIPELAQDYGAKFAGKIVIDPANAVARRDGDDLLAETKEKGIGVTTESYLKGSHVVRAFNSMSSTYFAKKRTGREIQWLSPWPAMILTRLMLHHSLFAMPGSSRSLYLFNVPKNSPKVARFTDSN